jgi:phosphate butyryltransferase
MEIRSVGDILQAACAGGREWTLSVNAPHDEAIMKAVTGACAHGFARALLFGDPPLIQKTAADAGLELTDRATIVSRPDPKEAIDESVEATHDGRAQILVKGLVPTSSVIRALLHKELGFRSGRFLSHVAVFDAPVYDRLMLLTDAGINITPNVQRKVQIVKNAVRVALALGMKRPKVAMLAAIDTLRYPAMQATLDAALVSRIARSGVVPEAVVDGPFALDNAVSIEAAKLKERAGEVAGRADILVAPEIETGNVLYKSLQTFCGTTYASVVVGADNPVAVPSRVDSPESMLASIALACVLSG